jgi:hypothetical protein
VTTRHCFNLPMLPDLAAVEQYADSRGALRVGGYRAADGTLRANIEITPDAAAEEIAAQAKQIEQQARALREFADAMKNHS